MSKLFLRLAFFYITSTHAQIKKRSKDAIEFYQKGEAALLKGDATKAIEYFEKVIDIRPEFHAAHRALGTSFELNNELDKTISSYEMVVQSNPKFSRILYYELALAYYRNKEYEEALIYFNTFKNLQSEDVNNFGLSGQKEIGYEKEYLQKLESSIEACKVAIDQSKYLNITEIVNLGPEINSKTDEYFPFLSNDLKTLFYTSRNTKISDENLYVAKRVNQKWKKGGTFFNGINTDTNEGMCSFTRDGLKMFFTACNRQNVLGNCDIQMASFYSGIIDTVNTLPGYSNSAQWESQASINCDGSVMYFASNRPGGFGGTDIWYSTRLEDGSWSEAKNVGQLINTKLDEEAPFITNDGKTLYFSSTGHLGMGEQDLFFSKKYKTGNWGKAINLGRPINSEHRELGFFLSPDGNEGYFASDRPSGFGGMDIYNFVLPDYLYTEPITFIEGFVKDSISAQPVQTILTPINLPSIKTDANGRFFICYPSDSIFQFTLEQDRYESYTKQVLIPTMHNIKSFNINVKLKPLPTALEKKVENQHKTINEETINHKVFAETIYFEYDDYGLTKQSHKILNRLVEKYKHKTISLLSFKGFTDQIGSYGYNFALSTKRANAAAEYLKSKRLIIKNIDIQGLGELKNGDDDLINRKVEIWIRL